MSELDLAIAMLQEKLGEAVLSVESFRGETTVEIRPESIVEACTLLRDFEACPFNFLAALTAVDYFPEEPRFAVVYQLYSLPQRVFLRLKARVPSDHAEVATIEGVFPNANWHEREVFDMFGVRFLGHSDPRRILMPQDWEGHPLRKDYPLGYEEVQFSFNFDEIDRRKPYAKE